MRWPGIVCITLLFLGGLPAQAVGLGWYLATQSGRGTWTYDDVFGQGFDADQRIDPDRSALGFALDLSPTDRRLVNYRLQAGLGRFSGEVEEGRDFPIAGNLDLTGLSVTQTVGFRLFQSQRVRLWAGPHFRTAIYVGDVDSTQPNDTLLLEYGGGAAIGANFPLKHGVILGLEGGFTFNRYNGVIEDSVTFDQQDFSGDDDGPFLAFSMFWGTGADRRGGDGDDDDGDGVADGQDRCDRTLSGARVDATGCPTDADGDDVPDGIDRCDRTLAGAQVDETGCPRDSDNDGVADGIDRCEKSVRGAQVDEAGCPRDSDNDGIADGIDRCEKTQGGTAVDETGCPRDSDNDGVADGIDRCDRTLAGAQVDETGCPRDSDNDGVADGIDRCEKTQGGTAVDATGCPKALEQISGSMLKPAVLDGVFFDNDSATLTEQSMGVLERALRSLIEWPELRVEIGGHSDSTGNEAYNLELSRRRAESVRDYFVQRGVDASRVTVRGYGPSRPAADNATEEGRARNRRVELRKIE